MLFQLGYVLSDMEMVESGMGLADTIFPFQLGHVFSDMEITGIWFGAIRISSWVSIGPRLFRHGNIY